MGEILNLNRVTVFVLIELYNNYHDQTGNRKNHYCLPSLSSHLFHVSCPDQMLCLIIDVKGLLHKQSLKSEHQSKNASSWLLLWRRQTFTPPSLALEKKLLRDTLRWKRQTLRTPWSPSLKTLLSRGYGRYVRMACPSLPRWLKMSLRYMTSHLRLYQIPRPLLPLRWPFRRLLQRNGFLVLHLSKRWKKGLEF